MAVTKFAFKGRDRGVIRKLIKAIDCLEKMDARRATQAQKWGTIPNLFLDLPGQNIMVNDLLISAFDKLALKV